MLAMPTLASSQGTGIDLGGFSQDTSLPVQVTSDSLSINQADGSAVFTGNVLVIQGDLRLTAAKVQVEYAATGNDIQRLIASGGVTMANATDAAEARDAVYSLADGMLEMTGDVLLTQGRNTISGGKLRIDLKGGTGVMEGRVQTTFTPGPSP